jgi:DnaJ domain
MMNSTIALEVFGLEVIPELSELKKIYRKLSKERHPDTGGSPKAFVQLQDAYDCLSSMAQAGVEWQADQAQNLKKWRKFFIDRWKLAYANAAADTTRAAGLHFSTCIEQFRREYIYPPREWFYHAIFGRKQQPEAYRTFLLQIAPNRLHQETYARKYWELECQEKWVFYLPPAIEQLREQSPQDRWAETFCQPHAIT